MIAEFMNFYHYKYSELLDMFAIDFYNLYYSMHRVKSNQNVTEAIQTASAFAGGDSLNEYVESQLEGSEGLKKFLREIKLLRSLK